MSNPSDPCKVRHLESKGNHGRNRNGECSARKRKRGGIACKSSRCTSRLTIVRSVFLGIHVIDFSQDHDHRVHDNSGDFHRDSPYPGNPAVPDRERRGGLAFGDDVASDIAVRLGVCGVRRAPDAVSVLQLGGAVAGSVLHECGRLG